MSPQEKIQTLLTAIQDSNELYLEIAGKPPAKKNSKQMVHAKGRMFMIPSKAHQEWHTQALWGLKPYQNALLTPKMILCTIYGKDARKFDLSNSFESVADLLVDAQIIKDDNYEYLSNIILSYGGTDKENPRSEVYIIY